MALTMAEKSTPSVEVESKADQNRRLYWANRDRICAQRRATYHGDIEKARADKRKRQERYRKRHPERVAASMRRWHQNNAEQVAVRVAAYAAANRGAVATRRANRRARLANADGRITKAIVAQILKDQDETCPYCLANLSIEPAHLDHKTPLSRGGSNLPGNLQWLCAPCNLSKATKTDDEYRGFLMKEAA